ncbi:MULTISPECIES: hypothetical protein [Nocardia]|uniref:hypothetical protein n=1 Tax=Nocardia TaxID=1817 RepID=UPI0007A4A367|nr:MULTISPECIES: hypothetical protein [Nocardia]MBF6276400.1 hypothetical protein [Nocardia nova]OBA45996.1 hypothetical protein A5789_05785 [Nocardia sp. 852002-51101_SCH5132738]OBB38581.1 hypothetical protein A5748_02690 [Nocardia sp. 852002-51244_SCH5132740]OBF82943.1 hypothetical protein A9X06_18435 [Mycobacterium sp. 852002-51759_SCH5129042]
MSEPSSKEITLAIRIDTARHAQLSWIAELRGTSLKAECFNAVDAYIEAAKNDPELMAKADAARAAIEEEARARQTAIANLFTASPPPPANVEDAPAPDGAAEAEETMDNAASQRNRRPRSRRGTQQGDGEQADS